MFAGVQSINTHSGPVFQGVWVGVTDDARLTHWHKSRLSFQPGFLLQSNAGWVSGQRLWHWPSTEPASGPMPFLSRLDILFVFWCVLPGDQAWNTHVRSHHVDALLPFFLVMCNTTWWWFISKYKLYFIWFSFWPIHIFDKDKTHYINIILYTTSVVLR